jgi:site-specific DNA-adenine methylase
MTADQHRALLEALAGLKGKFLLSGYPNEMYDDAARRCEWNRLDFVLPNHAAGGPEKRRMTECVWCNYDPLTPVEASGKAGA